LDSFQQWRHRQTLDQNQRNSQNHTQQTSGGTHLPRPIACGRLQRNQTQAHQQQIRRGGHVRPGRQQVHGQGRQVTFQVWLGCHIHPS